MIDLRAPARAVADLLDGVGDDQMSAPTPCEHYSVGDLLDHLMALTVAFTLAATKNVDPDEGRGALADESRPGEASVDHLDPEWRRRLPERLDRLAAAWSHPSAWEGTAEAGGVTMPASEMGTVVVDELVMHGWDLARATGQELRCDPASEQVVFHFTEATAQPGQEQHRTGLFGPVVEVPDDAPLLDRALGYAGRDPGWRPAPTPT